MNKEDFIVCLVTKKNKDKESFESYKNFFREASLSKIIEVSENFGIELEFLLKLSEQAKKGRFEIFVENLSCSFC